MEVERLANQIKIIVKTSRPGIVIGRRGSEVESSVRYPEYDRKSEHPDSGGRGAHPEIDAQLVAENVFPDRAESFIGEL